MIEPVGYGIVGLFALGMAVSFFAADPRSPTSRALSLFLALLGGTLVMNVPASGGLFFETLVPWTRLFSLAEIGLYLSSSEWLLRIGRTEVAADPGAARGEWLVRAAQALAVAYGLAGILLPEVRIAVWTVRPHPGLLLDPRYYLFAIPNFGAIALVAVRGVQIVRADIDPAERVRLVSLLLAAPFWIVGTFVGWRANAVSSAIGEVIFLVGAIRYHVLQGRRAQFLARFLSPQLARRVRDRGLGSVMQQERTELSVVACDLRGFTAFSEAAAPADVMRLLDAYYAAVGEAVRDGGGSIKDFAGDGILVLVGAPIRCDDHAGRAASLALAIRDRVEAVLGAWRGRELGVGVGVATGAATVGTLGGRERLEYAAVGPVVNLASRLAGHARAGQVLADAPTAAAARRVGLGAAEIGELALKGFSRPVAAWALAGSAPFAAAGATEGRPGTVAPREA